MVWVTGADNAVTLPVEVYTETRFGPPQASLGGTTSQVRPDTTLIRSHILGVASTSHVAIGLRSGNRTINEISATDYEKI